MERNVSTFFMNLVTTQLPFNATVHRINATEVPVSMWGDCEQYVEGLLFDMILQVTNVVVGIPANLFVIAILIHHRKEPSTSDIYLGCLAFLDIFFSVMTPINFLNMYIWASGTVWYYVLFAYGVKDTCGPLFLSCICLDRFMAVIFPIAFGRVKHYKYRLGLSIVVLVLTFTYAGTRMTGHVFNAGKVFTGEILATFSWMILCNVTILRALKKSRGAGKDEMHPLKKKAFKTVLSILCVIVFNYLPQVALFPFEDYFRPATFRCYVQPVAFAFMNISSTTQPLIYLSRLEKLPFFPESCQKKFICCVAEEKPDKSPAAQNPST